MHGAARAHGFQLLGDFADALVDAAAIGFELGFAGPACADASAQTRHPGAVACQARQQIPELCQFHLQPAFPGTRAAGEDVEDQLCAVDDLGVERLFQIALLRGCELVIRDHEVSRQRLHHGRQLLDLAGSDQRSSVGHGPGLRYTLDDIGIGAQRESRELIQGFFGIVRDG